ncbi:hypothetical protein PVK06_003133 [Gossypium arboreum]|uniref:Uncharacterized protein n=1 Tax=Gossypium arboreum TaxID=29729 RepID=A0ABR0R5L3_GOSAR|nr:hypothetical protein PVK06_003133 [Gossypium arboreum]
MQQTIECYRRHTKDNETNKPIQQNLQDLIGLDGEDLAQFKPSANQNAISVQ